MAVFNDKGGYMKLAEELSFDLETKLSAILKKYQKQGMTIEEILYVVNSISNKICLKNEIEKRLKNK